MTPRHAIENLSPKQKRALLARLVEKRDAEAKYYPVSFGQRRLWFLDQLSPASPFYNQHVALRLPYEVNVPALTQTIGEVVARHASLRTTFESRDSEPVQKVHPAEAVDVPVVDLGHLNGEAQEREAQRLATIEARTPFDLSRGPLIRPRLLRLGDREFVLLLTLHHIISDGWSVSLLFREIGGLYDAFSHGQPSPLPPLRVQYHDFAVWQRETLRGEVLESQMAFWRERLQGLTPLRLPADYVRPAVANFRGGHVAEKIPALLSNTLRAFSQREGVTLFMTMLAAFNALLARYCGQDDIVVGVPVTNRSRSELEDLIGFFINTLVMRTDLSGDPPFREAVRRVRDVAVAAYAHQDLPFEMLVEDLQPERDTSRNPLFQATFQVLNDPEIMRNYGGGDDGYFDVETGTSVFDLATHVFDYDESLAVQFDYGADLFEPASVQHMLDSYLVLLSSAMANPDLRLSELRVLSAHDRHRLLEDWNDTAVEYPRECAALQLIREQAARTPAAIAVRMDGRELAYGDLMRQAGAVAGALRRDGVQRGDAVAVTVGRSPEFVVAALGAWAAGAAYIPIEPSLPAQRRAAIVRDAGARLVLDESAVRAAIDKNAAADESWGPGPEDLAYIIYTSGSTGAPKGVEIAHRGLLNLVCWHVRQYELSGRDRGSMVASVSFDASAWELWPYLTAGAGVQIYGPSAVRSPHQLIEAMQADRVTVAFLPTPLAEAVLQQAWPSGGSLRYLLTGGDVLHSRPSTDLPFTLVNHYGPTEATVVTTAGVVSPAAAGQSMPAIGRPISNSRVYVLDQFLNLAPVGAVGELYVAGDGLARGYRNRPDWSAERFVACPFEPEARMYRTGDLVRFCPSGELQFLSRADQQIKLRGFRIEPAEIEAAFLRHPTVDGAAVVVRGEGDNRRLIAFVSLRANIQMEELRGHLKLLLPEYMVPSAIIRVETMPMNNSGKIDRKALQDAAAGVEFRTGYIAPRNDLEREIAQVWQEVLDLRQVSVEDNFFDLGGHSLLLVRLQEKLRITLSRPVQIVDLFRYPSVAAFAQSLGAVGQDDDRLWEAESRAARQRNALGRRTPGGE